MSHCIKNLKSGKSIGHDGLSNNIIKFLEPLLCAPLTLLINQSLKTGIFPDKLKLARISPIYKKDDPHLVENYRPISILPSVSKIFEKIVFQQLSNYFVDNNYLCHHQYGFRKKHSTEHAILEAVDRIGTELDIGNISIAIFLDLSKAFDTLNHDILLAKLKYYGLSESSVAWFRSYLTNRSHYVEINNVRSGSSLFSIGVPQGSILGPLLFLIYINDIQASSRYFSFIKYADDTTLLKSFKNINFDINDELCKVYEWLCTNRLSLNIKKTKFIIFHNKNKNIQHIIPIIKINNIPIERVTYFNFLGVTFNENLNWNNHVDTIATKISRAIGILNNLKYFVPLYVLYILYNSLILSHCTYGILAWGKVNDKIFKLQKKAIRIITNSNYISHTTPIFKNLNLLKMNDIYKISVLKFYYQYCHDQLPYYLQSFDFTRRAETHHYNTRNKSALNIKKVNIVSASYILRNSTPKIINETPSVILDKITTHSLQGFMSYAKYYYINNYSDVCSILNCYSCLNS